MIKKFQVLKVLETCSKIIMKQANLYMYNIL